MSTALDRLPTPQPDVQRLKTVLRRGMPDRVPLIELMIADEVLAEFKGSPLAAAPTDRDAAQWRRWADDRVKLWHRLGYDYYRGRAEIPFLAPRLPAQNTSQMASGDRQWVDEHQGAISSMADVERYPWPKSSDIDFAPTEAALAVLPDGMEGMGFSGGVLEWASTLMGLENFMMALYDEPELIRAVADRVGQTILSAFETFCTMDRIFAIWLGDDMGFKTSTLIAPEQLREYILPWHKRYAELAHRTGRFFLLHSCGHIEAIMPDLVDDIRIDGKHSFEDLITPVEQFKSQWGSRVAVLGGVDVDLLSRGSLADIRSRTQKILEVCSPGGGYAAGSGNSITNYTPAESFLAMIETVHRFNGRM